MPVTLYSTPQAPQSSHPTGGGGRKRLSLSVLLPLVIAAMLLVGMLIYLAVGGRNASSQPSSAAATSTASASVKPVQEVAPGLARGSAPVNGTSRGAVAGVPTGFPRTVDGAASAAMNYLAGRYSPANFQKATRDQITAQLCMTGSSAWACASDSGTELLEKRVGIGDDGKGRINGQVDARATVIAAGYPDYGAYKVLDTGELPDENDKPTMSIATIEVWMPTVLGNSVSGEAGAVTLEWVDCVQVLQWYKGDWRVLHAYVKNLNYPTDPSFTNQPFTERAKALGPGWSVPSDATEAAVPGRVKTK